MRLPRRTPLACLVMAIAVAACAGEPVPLLTGDDLYGRPSVGDAATGSSLPTIGCYTNFTVGILVVDATYGTAITDEATGGSGPVRWPTGYTARRSGSEVEVLDREGHVVAQTGRRYQIEGAFVGEEPRAWLACGYVLLK